MNAVQQQFPYRENNEVKHRRWSVDVKAAASLAGINAERFSVELADMAVHFPRWILTVSQHHALVRCQKCDGMVIFDRGARCVACDVKASRLPGAARPAWFGVMPPIGIDGLARIKDGLLARPPKGHVVGHREGLGNYLLVPLVVTYPPQFPLSPVEVFYLPEFRTIPGMPQEEVSHAFHMVGHGKMCLFAAGEWIPEMGARTTLQQRAYAHVVKFLNYANGKRNAFAVVS